MTSLLLVDQTSILHRCLGELMWVKREWDLLAGDAASGRKTSSRFDSGSVPYPGLCNENSVLDDAS